MVVYTYINIYILLMMMMMMTTMMMMMMMKVTQPEQPERPHLRSWPYGPDQDS